MHIHTHTYIYLTYRVVITELSDIFTREGNHKYRLGSKYYWCTMRVIPSPLLLLVLLYPADHCSNTRCATSRNISCTKFLTQQKPHAELNWINLCNWYHLPSSSSSFSISFFVWNWSPQNEKLQSLLVCMIWGNLYLCGSPDNASCSIAAPPLRCDMWVSVFKRNLRAV